MRCSPAGVLRRYGHLYKGAGRQAAIALESQVSPDLKNPPYHNFRTPGHAVYCGVDESRRFLCMTPNDGFWCASAASSPEPR